MTVAILIGLIAAIILAVLATVPRLQAVAVPLVGGSLSLAELALLLRFHPW
jgi:hypothetical protein